MVAAERAQATLVLSTEAIPASPAALTAITGMDALTAIAAMGLTIYTTEEQ
jgi:alcohol dehydrogenase class IV